MDSLALLCNLYGNGPATLRRLREAGCDAIPSLLELPVDELADLLVDSPDSARRFLREAGRLAARVSESVFEVEGSSSEGDFEEEREAPSRVDEDAQELVEAGQDPLVEQALAAWRERDARERSCAEDFDSDEPEPIGPEPSYDDAPRSKALEPGLVGGLDERWCTALELGGVTTLDALAECDVDRVALATCMPITRLMRLRYLAGQSLSELNLVTNPARELDEPPSAASHLPAPGPGAAAAIAHTRGPDESTRTLIPEPAMRFSPAERPDTANSSGLESDLLAASRHQPPHTYRPSEPSKREVGGSAGPFA
jgi:hypothetical protein